MKCAYKHCLHESPDVEKADAVKVGKRYMHPDCAAHQKAYIEVAQFYQDNAKQPAKPVELYKVLNDLIFERRFTPQYILFVMKMAINSGTEMHSPRFLCYLVDDDNYRHKWLERQAEQIIKGMAQPERKDFVSFKYTGDHGRTLLDIVEGL